MPDLRVTCTTDHSAGDGARPSLPGRSASPPHLSSLPAETGKDACIERSARFANCRLILEGAGIGALLRKRRSTRATHAFSPIHERFLCLRNTEDSSNPHKTRQREKLAIPRIR